MKLTKKQTKELNDLILREALGFFLCDDDLLKAWRKLARANEIGKDQKWANEFCEPVQDYEYHTVSQLVGDIDSLRDQFDKFLVMADKIRKV